MNNPVPVVLFGLLAAGLAGRVPRNAPNCTTVYDTKWQTVYHEYEVNKCTTQPKQVCHDYTYTQCTKVDGTNCRITLETTCNMTHTLQKENYTESECSKTCVPHCEYHWEEDDQGNKVWVEDKNTCKYEEEENCVDVVKERTWKNFKPEPINVERNECLPNPDVKCEQVEDQFCTEVNICECVPEHKKVPIRVSIKQPKIVCQDTEETNEKITN